MKDSSRVKSIFWVTLGLNLAVALAKLFFAAKTRSLSIFSDGLHSLLDGGSNVVALFSLWIAERPPDEDHPYGHRKFETLGAMGISAMLCLAAWEILTGAWHRILSPVKLPEVHAWVVVGMLGMIAINMGITWYERHWGRKLQSTLLLADAEHTKSDVLASVLALISIQSAFLGWYWMDTAGAIAIVGLILWAAYHIIHDSVLTLTDAQRLDPIPVRRLVEGVEGVRNCHMVRSHGPTQQVHVDLHIVVSPTLSAEQVFKIENSVMDKLKVAYPEVSEVTVRHQTHMPSDPSATPS